LLPGISDGRASENSTLETCLEWIASLPSYTPPTWIGLDLTAEVERQQAADGRDQGGDDSEKDVTVMRCRENTKQVDEEAVV
jgi:hypothetical protein